MNSGSHFMDKTIRRVTDPDEQQAESYRYWQSLSVGERLMLFGMPVRPPTLSPQVSKECQ
jgi:hypothetical protein